MHPYANKVISIGDGIGIGFDEQGPRVVLRKGLPSPGSLATIGAVSGMREELLRRVAFLTLWLEQIERREEGSRVVVPSPADVQRVGLG